MPYSSIMAEKTDELLTREEVARKLKVSDDTVQRLTKAGELRVFKVGKRLLRYKSCDLGKFGVGE